MQRQLSIFDTLQPLDTALSNLKPGDWVKLLRKTPSAAYWKKGEIVQVEAVHPTNGSVKFWNERAQDWAYLHPGDMTKTLPPIDVLPPSAIAPVEELPPVADVAESTAPSLVAESSLATCEIDSATSQPIELVAYALDMQQATALPPIELVAESSLATGEIDSATRAVSTYKPKGSARSGEYFRFVYRAGTKTKSVHIPGGNTGNTLAQQRASEVLELSAAGVPALEICEHIKRWSTRNHLETW